MDRVLMLDVDGVLVTHRRAGAGSWQDGLEADLGIVPEALRDGFFLPHWAEIVTGRRALIPTLAAALGRMRVDLTAEALRDYWFAQDGLVVAEVLADVDAMRAEGLPVWLATNQEHCRAAFLMEDMGLGTRVDGMIYSAEVGAKKPEAAFFAAAARAVEGAACMLVDDTLANVEAARQAGWQAHHWQAGDRLREVVGR